MKSITILSCPVVVQEEGAEGSLAGEVCLGQVDEAGEGEDEGDDGAGRDEGAGQNDGAIFSGRLYKQPEADNHNI